MINNKTDLTCDSCGSPIMILQDKNGLRYECIYCGLSHEDDVEVVDDIDE